MSGESTNDFLLRKRLDGLDPNEDYSLIHHLSHEDFTARFSLNGVPELEVRELTDEEKAFLERSPLAQL